MAENNLELDKFYLTTTGKLAKVSRLANEEELHSYGLTGTVGYVVENLSDKTIYSIFHKEDGTRFITAALEDWGDIDFDKTASIPNMENYLHQHIHRLEHMRSAKEAFEHLRLWGEAVFGPVDPKRIVERAKEELDKELLPAVEHGWTEKALEEAADVVVILTRAPGLWAAIERKMAINYNRKWDIKGDGTGYHIPSVKD